MDAVKTIRQGWIAERRGHVDQALALANRLLGQEPDHIGGRHLRAVCQRKLGRLEAAAEELVGLLKARPDYAIGHRELGMIRIDQSRYAEAFSPLMRAVELQPRDPASHVGVGIAFRHLRKWFEAEQAFRNALRLDPNQLGAHFNLASTLLTVGRWKEGFEHYERRLDVPNYPIRKLPVERPLYRGQSLQGKRLLLRGEQGLGDVIMGIRFARELAGWGASVRLQCHPSLRRLLASAEGVEAVGDERSLPAYDFQLPLMSSLHRLGVSPATLWAPQSYLSTTTEVRDRWARRFAPSSKLRVGLVWRSRPIPRARFHLENRDKERKTLELEDLTPLLRMPGIHWFSLQKEHTKEDQPWMQAHQIEDLSDSLEDFAETAGCIQSLDAVVSMDTAVAHLAGALGRPTLTLLTQNPDWRWLLEREDSPWYPTMRLARCTAQDDWSAAVAKGAEVMKEWRRGRG